MKIYLSDIASHTVDRIIINSLEQALYQVMVVVDGEEHVVWVNDQKTLIHRNLTKLREQIEHIKVDDIVLRHESPYDEMIGQPVRAGSNRLEVKLGKNPYAQASWLQ